MLDKRTAKIQEALRCHHDKVKEKYRVVMTVLCGSQNYWLDTEDSDYDTFTFVLPTLADIAMNKEPVSTLEEDEYGHIEIKDIRLALNLLKKTSPNSVEWFATKYRIIDPRYADLFERFITPETLRCDTKHMMNAIAGMAHQLTKRNMPSGKRYSHLVRMECMVENYYLERENILEIADKLKRGSALLAKLTPNDELWEPLWDYMCPTQEKLVKNKIAEYEAQYGARVREKEAAGKDNVNKLQVELIGRYLWFELKIPMRSLDFSPENEVWNNA